MSRIGKKPVSIPSDIKVNITDSGLIEFSKANKKIEVNTKNQVNIELNKEELIFTPKSDDRAGKAFWGTYRSLSANAIEGLANGYSKQLELNGVGYRVALKGKSLDLQLGFSHPINFALPEGIDAKVEKNVITISGHDKQQVGQVSAQIREFRPPEPYKGKGVKYMDEHIIRKAGKTAAK